MFASLGDDDYVGAETMMRQCELTRPVDGGVGVRVAWIPEEVARLGNVVRLRIHGEWVPGYKVTAIYGRQTYRETNLRSRDHLKHRKNSDRQRRS